MNIFITGATSGFGWAMVERFARDGANIIATGRRMERLILLQEKYPNQVLPVALDVRSFSSVETALRTLPSRYAEIDVLINNAGLALGLGSAADAEISDWDTMVDTNIKGLMYCTRAVLPGMLKRNSGHIVNLGSVAGEFPYPGGNVYGATKAFVYQFSLNLRADLIGSAVRVTDIQPGLCGGTEFSNVRLKGDNDKAKAVYEGTDPLTAEDVADAVHWVVSRPARVNINSISMMPVCQAFGPFAIQRSSKR